MLRPAYQPTRLVRLINLSDDKSSEMHLVEFSQVGHSYQIHGSQRLPGPYDARRSKTVASTLTQNKKYPNVAAILKTFKHTFQFVCEQSVRYV